MKKILHEGLRPLVYLSNNWASLTGVVIVTTVTIIWLCLLPVTLRGEITHPYAGILIYFVLPGIFFSGLILIPAGILWKRRQQHRTGVYPDNFPPLDFQNHELRKLVAFVGVTTIINVIVSSQFAYGAVNYMDSVTFCGQTCHTVMKPEFTAHQGSPHARVECVQCHIGPGASWFVRSKLSGLHQLYAVAFHTYSTPIAVPVANLRPARETCETCHWPQRFDEDRVRDIPKFSDDEHATLTHTVLLLHIGGGMHGSGIHGMHLGQGIHVRYAASDNHRQVIPWVEYTSGGKTTVFASGDTKPNPKTIRDMDCVDCHNRPTHVFDLPERAVDKALVAGGLSADLPFVKKEAVAVLKKPYTNDQDAALGIPADFENFYKKNYPDVYAQHRDDIDRSAQQVLAIFQRNVFPAMKITWGTYPNNIGHTDSDGCFRCHDDLHKSPEGKTITQDCDTCHNVLAVDERSPKILTDLGFLKASKQ